MSGIDGVIYKMDQIVDECSREGNPAGYFAVLHRLVTIEIKNQMEIGTFDSNERVEMLDKIFAQRFFDAYDSWYNGEGKPATNSWRVAFETADRADAMIIPDYSPRYFFVSKAKRKKRRKSTFSTLSKFFSFQRSSRENIAAMFNTQIWVLADLMYSNYNQILIDYNITFRE